MGIQIDQDFDLWLHRECGGDTSWVGGYLHGALDAFIILAWAQALHDTYLCTECNQWRPPSWVRRNGPCQCWNDE